jgi:mono/diheme cytochrome c family protein
MFMQWKALVAVLGIGLALTSACRMERRRSDAELGLNAEQARGRRIYDQHCIRCHEPYNSWGTHGPSLKNLSRKPYLPSGMPANDARLRDVILLGRAKMPSFGKTLSDQQLDWLLAYLKTL